MARQTTMQLVAVASILATYRDEIPGDVFVRIVRDLAAYGNRVDAQFDIAAFEARCRLERAWLNYRLFDA